ncbi:hypothetical protein [Rhizobium sp. RU36D]|uniref:hypothetical protein n=1 Tax=Rhizobium sp. RU36D TaxID=1907415 RepID=UPI0009D7EE50|nr:hypothetical protein [Rhizobium sp. RU36D]SMD12696.1 CRISPR system Cascade subunit CasB [Rhizobium sp. RU36D]
MPEVIQTKDEDLKPIIATLVSEMMKLGPSNLARLRRMDVEGPGELEFWRLVRDTDILGDTAGMQIVKLLALLAPRGESASRTRFHQLDQPLGKVLAEAKFSEKRLASFMALPFERRGEALEVIARVISRDMRFGVNCVDFALLLFLNEVWPLRRLATAYYVACDRKAAFEDREKTNE